MSELAVGSLSGLAANSYVIDVASGSQLTQPGMVLQVVQGVKSNTFTTTSATAVEVTGLSASITPTSTTSKILVMASVNFSSDGAQAGVSLVRDSTQIYGGNAIVEAASYVDNNFTGGFRVVGSSTLVFLDSPSSTSSLTYKVFLMSDTTENTATINRRGVSGATENLESSITLMEVAA